MANLKVSLIRLCKTPSGWKRYNVAFDEAGKLKPNKVIVRGREREYPVGHYELRRYDGRRTKIENVGDDPVAALKSLHLKSQSLRLPPEVNPGDAQAKGLWISLPKSGLDRAEEIARAEGVTLTEWASYVIAQKIKDSEI